MNQKNEELQMVNRLSEDRQVNNRITGSCLAVIIVVAIATPQVAGQGTDLPGWELTWQDEFDSEELDLSEWEPLTRQNSFNNEKQYYLPEQASIVDGKLRITATDEPIANKLYRSARLESVQTFGPGRFEARIDLPTGQGMWPAFWLVPNDPDIPWPTGGEIDILENRGSEPLLVSSAYHWQAEPGPCCSQHRFVSQQYSTSDGGVPVDFHDGFHTYAAEWESDEIRFFVDGQLHFTVRESSSRPIFETPKNIVLNLAVGGFFGGDPDATTVFPQNMDIDYVRFWQRVPEPSTAILLAFGSLGVFWNRGRNRHLTE